MLLLLSAKVQKGQRADRQVGLQRGGNRLIDLAQLFEGRHHGHGAGAGATVLLGDEQAHQLQVCQLLKDLGRKILGIKPFIRVGRDLFAGKIAAHILQHLLFSGQFKVHTSSPLLRLCPPGIFPPALPKVKQKASLVGTNRLGPAGSGVLVSSGWG